MVGGGVNRGLVVVVVFFLRVVVFWKSKSGWVVVVATAGGAGVGTSKIIKFFMSYSPPPLTSH